ncbi:MAG: ECF transporter S component [Lactobacillales bacterium]|jgi:riboflavin transporter FmnP|nr:ECF transporter S component [Lactobacillales bacterium]
MGEDWRIWSLQFFGCRNIEAYSKLFSHVKAAYFYATMYLTTTKSQGETNNKNKEELIMTSNKTRKLVLIAILSAISTVLMAFVQIPMFGGFMKLDFSVLPILIGLVVLGLPSAMAILILRSILVTILFSEGVSTYIGMPMNIVAIGLFVIAIWFFIRYDLKFNAFRFLLGGIAGTIILTAAMALLNFIYAIPLYEKFANFKLSAVGMTLKDWIVAMVLPFNLIQGAILTIVSGLILISFSKFLYGQKKNFE